jgi:hypothetical protein
MALQLRVNGQPVPLKPWIARMMQDQIHAMVGSLKGMNGADNARSIEVTIAPSPDDAASPYHAPPEPA